MRALLLTLVLAVPTGAQLSTPGTPPSFSETLDAVLPARVLARPDVPALLAEDEKNGPFPLRYGAVLPLAFDLVGEGRWDTLADGRLGVRAEITAPGAHSLGLLFAEYDLPPGGELYVYSPDRERLIGAFGEATEQPNGMLAIQPFAGDRLVLEYVQPANAAAPRLTLESVVYDYRGVLGELELEPGGSGPEAGGPEGCLIDANCPEGALYQNSKRSVIALFRGGFLCSGSILNNTAEDGTPFMYTAEHCGNFTNGTFRFRYERALCGGGATVAPLFLSGSQRLADNNFVDSQLYRLNQSVPASHEPFFAGWNRTTAVGAPTFGVSHPAGLPKKLHIENGAANDTGTQWGVSWDEGEIQGGSSGSPLFDSSGRAIGPLCCGSGVCSGQTVFYGRFGTFWNQEGLEQWLDPLATGQSALRGYDPFQATSTPYQGSGGNAPVLTSNPPALGATWTAEVDVAAIPGATGSVLLIHAARKTGVFVGAGEVLVDLASPLLLRSTAGVVGNLSSHSFAIPNDPLLAGRSAYAQAVVLGGAARATNALDLRVL